MGRCGLQIEPWKRPRFAELVHSLEAMKYSALMKVILMDLSRLDSSAATPAATTDTAMDREVLENILGTVYFGNIFEYSVPLEVSFVLKKKSGLETTICGYGLGLELLDLGFVLQFTVLA